MRYVGRERSPTETALATECPSPSPCCPPHLRAVLHPLRTRRLQQRPVDPLPRRGQHRPNVACSADLPGARCPSTRAKRCALAESRSATPAPSRRLRPLHPRRLPNQSLAPTLSDYPLRQSLICSCHNATPTATDARPMLAIDALRQTLGRTKTCAFPTTGPVERQNGIWCAHRPRSTRRQRCEYPTNTRSPIMTNTYAWTGLSGQRYTYSVCTLPHTSQRAVTKNLAAEHQQRSQMH